MKKIIAFAAILITAVFLPAGEVSAAVNEPGRYSSGCVCTEDSRNDCRCRVTQGGVCLCTEVNMVKECMGTHHHGNSGTEKIQQPAGNGSSDSKSGSGTAAPKKSSSGSSGKNNSTKQGSPSKTKKSNKHNTNNSGHGSGSHNSKHGSSH